uniref:uncharacterized protein LOC122582636 n=1 Tax=Erigeron canadensis TaxID=72917 RepID=UPI001CB898F9|nr:uncharacterized protein LOC122582636 [Erigeron canadensis]
MKASIKFREEQKPLFRAKIPVSVIGFPFQSGVVAGESKELSLNLATFFESGPSVKIAYRPNDSVNPFSLVFKTGIGKFGSPISSALNMSAEFNFITGSQSQNPRFFVKFKPHFGDFSVQKTQSSVFSKESDENGIKFIGLPEYFPSTESKFPATLNGVLSELELTARTSVPLRKNAAMSFRWGVRVPATEDSAAVLVKKSDLSTAGIWLQRLPCLLINKIGIEHVARDDCKEVKRVGLGDGDVASFMKQMETIQVENMALRKAIENLKSEFTVVRNGNNGKYNGGDEGYFGGKGIEGKFVEAEE